MNVHLFLTPKKPSNKGHFGAMPHRARRAPRILDDGSDMRSALREVRLFQRIDEDSLSALIEAIEVREYSRGASICEEDQIGDAFYVVLKGDLEVLQRRTVGKKLQQEVIGKLGPADCFGEIALLEGTLRTATVHCVTDCRLGRLDKDAFTKLVLDRVGLLQIRQTLQAAAFLGRLTFLAGTSFPDLCEIAEHCRIPKKR